MRTDGRLALGRAGLWAVFMLVGALLVVVGAGPAASAGQASSGVAAISNQSAIAAGPDRSTVSFPVLGASIGSAATAVLPGGPPFGVLDSVTAAQGQVTVGGWVIDPDTIAPITVHIYIDGSGTALVANASRPDIAASFPGFGPDHGYHATITAPAGTHSVCAYGIDTTDPTMHTTLGCEQITIPAN